MESLKDAFENFERLFGETLRNTKRFSGGTFEETYGRFSIKKNSVKLLKEQLMDFNKISGEISNKLSGGISTLLMTKSFGCSFTIARLW